MKLTEAQEAWLQDLETTDAPQTRSALENDYGFCCLGRACVVARQHGIAVNCDMVGVLKGISLNDQGPVLKWLGLGSGHGDPKDADLPLLVNLNDNGNSFKKIAAIIRANPEQYFVAHESDNRDSVKA